MNLYKLSDIFSEPPPTDKSPASSSEEKKPTTPVSSTLAQPSGQQTAKSPTAINYSAPINKSVVKMQNEMLRFHDAFYNDIKPAKNNLTQKQLQGPIEGNIGEKTETYTPADNFITGIFDRHLEHTTGKSDKFINKLLSLQSIGSFSKGKPQADGVWGKKTDAGLQNILSMSQSMLDIAKKFQIPMYFNEKDIEELKKSIKNKSAEPTTEILEKITNSVDGFISQIENNTSSRRHDAEIDAGINTGYDPKRKSILENQSKYLNNISLDLGQNLELNLANLKDRDSLANFIEQNLTETGTDDKSMVNFLTNLENGIRSGKILIKYNKILQTER